MNILCFPTDFLVNSPHSWVVSTPSGADSQCEWLLIGGLELPDVGRASGYGREGVTVDIESWSPWEIRKREGSRESGDVPRLNYNTWVGNNDGDDDGRLVEY